APAVLNRVTGATHTAQTTTTYDPDGNVTSQTVADTNTGGDSPRTATRTYNGFDQLASQTDPAGARTTYTYDAFGNRASQTDPDGNLTQYTYDGDGHLLTTKLANYTGSPPGSKAAASLTEESRWYDPAGRQAGVTDALGQDTDFWYTDNGLLAGVQEFTASGSKTYTSEWNSYDGAGNLIERWTNNWVTDTTYTVDAASRTTAQVTDPDGLNRSTTVTYTPDDQRASVTQTGPDGASQATSYTYDPAGNVLSQSVTDPGAGGPAAWYSLSQSSGTAVPDSVSGGQPATASGVTWAGGAATFSGTAGSQVATSGPVVDTTGSFTVSAWVNLAGNTSSNQTVVSQDASTDSGFYLKYFPGSGGWLFMRPFTDTTDPSSANAFSAGPAVTGTWTFLTGTYDANTGAMTLYVNGAASGAGTDTTPVAAHGPLVIGRAKWDGWTGDWFDGQVANVQMYPRALSAAQVSALYGLGQGGADVTTNALTTTWTRDQRGLPTSVTSPDGAVTSYSYDEAGLPAVTTDPPVTAQAYGSPVVTARPVTMTGYNTFGEIAETEDANGNVTTNGYDADGRPVSQTLPPYTPPGGSPITAVSTTVYDGDGLVTSETDGLGNITRYGYDQLGDQVTATAPDNSVTTTAYDNKGEPLSVTGPTGAQTQVTWDYVGRKLTATQLERYTGSGTAAYTTNYTYDDNAGGFLSQVASPDGVTTAYSYDEAGERTAVTDGASNTTSYAYNSLGQQTKVTFPDGTATAAGYDGAGNPVSVQQLNASGTVLASTSAAYDGEGDEQSATDALGNPSTFTFDPTGMVTAEVQPVTSSSAVTTSFGYDLNGHRTLYTDGNGQPWQYTYNSWGLPESRVEPSTAQYSSAANSTFTTAYNADGNPVTVTKPGGVTLTSTYNSVGEMTGQSGSGADAATPTRTFGYDLAGDLTSASTSNTLGTGSNATSESFTYNDRGQVLTASGSAGSTSYAYNGDGLTASVADAAGTTGYTYDNADRLSTLADPATGTTATYS
ncbi:MAG TPA: LamG-like jellyroll fold domain-containing protein, partial [Nakamurella sp.]